MDTNFIMLLCVILGGLSNTGVQFLSAILKAAEPIKFDQKYVATLGMSMIVAIFAAFGVFMALPIPADVPILYVAIPALLSGYSISNVANLGIDTYQAKKPAAPDTAAATVTPPPS
jgi:ABC-type Na+ efflux pump permease subunit